MFFWIVSLDERIRRRAFSELMLKC